MEDPIFAFVLAERIAKELKKNLLNDDLATIRSSISSLNKKYRNMTIRDKLEVYSSIICDEIAGRTKKNTSPKFPTDMKEYQVSQIGANDPEEKTIVDTGSPCDVGCIEAEISAILNTKQTETILSIFNPKERYKRKLLVLNSNNQEDELNGTGVMAWRVIPSRDFADGSINTSKSIRNIVGMQLLTSRFTYSNSFRYLNNLVPRWTVCIEEMKAQSFVGPRGQKFNGRSQLYANIDPNVVFTPSYSTPSTFTENTQQRRFHFMLGIAGQGAVFIGSSFSYYDFSPHNFNEGYYWFRKPFSVLPDRLTLSFGCPFNIFAIRSNKRSGLITRDSVTNQLVVAFANAVNPQDADSLPLLFGDCRLEGFTTANPVADAALIASVNGHVFTPVSISNRSVMEFPVDLTGITLVENSSMQVYNIDKYYHIFPLVFIYTDE